MTPLHTDDEITQAYAQGRLLHKDVLEHGAYYRGFSRNADVARWHALAQAFFYPRTKLGETQLDSIRHPADDRRFDAFQVFEKVEPAADEVIADAQFEGFYEVNKTRRFRPKA